MKIVAYTVLGLAVPSRVILLTRRKNAPPAKPLSPGVAEKSNDCGWTLKGPLRDELEPARPSPSRELGISQTIDGAHIGWRDSDG